MLLLRIAILLGIVTAPSLGSAQDVLATHSSRPQSYLLRGTVKDGGTGRAVVGAQIWPDKKGWGAISDSGGRFELHWPIRSVWTFSVSACGRKALARFQVDFFHDSIIERRISVPRASRRQCQSGDRPPWTVDARDTTLFRGRYTYSWEGGGWLTSCSGQTHWPDWDSALEPLLREHKQREGQRTFVQMRGRVAPSWAGDVFPGPIFLVRTVDEVREPQPDDCP